MIEIKNVSKNFGTKKVLKTMNFSMNPGTIFGLIGINGAGKSTLLRLLSGVLKPDEGNIMIDGKDVNLNPEIKRNLFYLSDEPTYGLFTNLSDMKKLYETFYDFKKEVFDEIIDMFKLDTNAPINKFSKGMRRQGYLALAFASGAKYLLFDEVFDGLDPKARLMFKQFMIKRLEDNQIIIITSHSLRELEDICDSFGMIDDGIFKKFGQIDTELSKVRKFQIILKNQDNSFMKEVFKPLHLKQDNRIVTIITQDVDEKLETHLLMDNVLVIDELPISFEEYFIVNQEVTK